ncbi:hypothetical protein IFO70_38770 [Phormidium tenue FACHB-886]|nr:hypothetical protein [Phormidium tenue FACHB-886]
MSLEQSDEIKSRLFSQASALVEKATGGTSNMRLVEALLEVCSFLEDSSRNDAPIVAVERNVILPTGTYHLAIRRLSSSIPAGKFQIIITRELASGLIYPQNEPTPFPPTPEAD